MRSDGLVLEHSVDVAVTPDFAWEIRTDVSTWDDPPARFSIEGAFVEGARGTTIIPGQDPLRWVIGLVVPGRSFVVEVLLEGALLSFEWHFDPLADQRNAHDSAHSIVRRERGSLRCPGAARVRPDPGRRHEPDCRATDRGRRGASGPTRFRV